MEFTIEQIQQFLKIEKETIGSIDHSNSIRGVVDETDGHETTISMTTSFIL